MLHDAHLEDLILRDYTLLMILLFNWCYKEMVLGVSNAMMDLLECLMEKMSLLVLLLPIISQGK